MTGEKMGAEEAAQKEEVVTSASASALICLMFRVNPVFGRGFWSPVEDRMLYLLF